MRKLRLRRGSDQLARGHYLGWEWAWDTDEHYCGCGMVKEEERANVLGFEG
jgi:hypothetical protein